MKFKFSYIQSGYQWLLVQLIYLVISSSLLMCSGEAGRQVLGQETCVESIKNSLTVATCHNGNRIPEGIRADIQSLILDHNKISRIESKEFDSRGLLHLQRLSLKNNNIRSIDRDAFEGLQRLNFLDFSSNKLDNIDPKIFAPLVNLQELKLSGNPLRRFVNAGTKMPKLLSLKILDLSNCLLTTLHAGFFDNIYNLEKLDLSGNMLQEVSTDVVSPLRLLNSLNLAKNPWKCSCHIRDFHKWVVDRKLASNTYCTESNRKWEDMASEEFFCAPFPVVNYLRSHAITKFPDEAGDVIIEDGSNVTFECQVEAEPSPDILWIKDDKILYSSVNKTDLKNDKYVVVTLEVGNWRKRSSLTVKDIKFEDRGVYSCQGANTVGEIQEKRVHLAVKDHGGGYFPGKTWLWILVGVLGGAILLLALGIAVSCYVKHRRGTRGAHRVADGEELTFEKKPPVADETDPAVSSSLLQNPDVVLAQETPLATLDRSDSIQSGRIENPAVSCRPSSLIYGKLHRLSTTSSCLVNSEIFFPHQFDHPDGGSASFDPRRAPQTPVSSQCRPPGPYGRLYSPFSGSVASFSCETTPRALPGLGYVSLPRRRQAPSWNQSGGYPPSQSPIPACPTGSLPRSNFRMRFQPAGPRYDTLGPRTTAGGGSNSSLNTAGLTQNQPAFGHTSMEYTAPMHFSTLSTGRIPSSAWTSMTPLSRRTLQSGSKNYMTHINFDQIHNENDCPPTAGAAPSDNLWSHRDDLNKSILPTLPYQSLTPLYSLDHGQITPRVPPRKPTRKSMNFDEQDKNFPNLESIIETEV